MAGKQSDHGQGEVKHPESDRRLKQNRDQESGQRGGQHAQEGHGGGEAHDTSGRGQVKDPEHDGRLKENKDRGVSLHTTDGKEETEHGQQGRVKDPEHDRRLKDNR